MLGLLDLGLLGIIAFVVLFILLLPSILTIIVGVGFANHFGFVGLTWWAFVGLFYIIVMVILAYFGI